ncbi:MAG: hypothetical protein AAF485_05350 [Chloroflexota bacterium]
MTDQTVAVLPREIRAAARWGFRAAQQPAGYSDPASEMVIYNEAYHQRGITNLHRQLLSFQNQAITPLSLIHDDDALTILDSHNQSTLICGPPAIDLACACAKQTGIYTVAVQNASFGFSLLEQLAERAARRFLSCLIMFHRQEQYHTVLALADEETFLIKSITTRLPSKTYLDLLDLIAQQQALTANTVSDQLFLNTVTISQRLLEPSDQFLLFCLTPTMISNQTAIIDTLDQTLAQMSEENLLHTSTYLADEQAARYEQIQAAGMPVEASLWGEIKRFGQGIFVPTSDRPKTTGKRSAPEEPDE